MTTNRWNPRHPEMVMELTHLEEGQQFYVRAPHGFTGRALTFRGYYRQSRLGWFEGPNGETVWVGATAPVETVRAFLDGAGDR